MTKNKALERLGSKFDPERVRYIKLGREGCWEKECLDNGIIRFGFGSATDERFPLCGKRKWGALAKSFMAEGKAKGTATRFTNETRMFFEDDGSILWITFIGARLCWGFLEPGPAERHPNGDGVFRKLKGGWRREDMKGEPLTTDRLSGALTKLSAYRGTSCGVDVAEYVVRRIKGQKTPEVERAISALEVSPVTQSVPLPVESKCTTPTCVHRLSLSGVLSIAGCCFSDCSLRSR